MVSSEFVKDKKKIVIKAGISTVTYKETGYIIFGNGQIRE